MQGKKHGILRGGERIGRTSPWLLVISLPLAGLLLVLALRGIQWHETVGAIRQCRPTLLLLAAAALTLSYVARGFRWQLLIGVASPISPRMAFWTTMIGYLANNVLPARPGDVIRPILTSRIARTSVSFALAAVFLERIADILALVLMSIVASFSHGTTPLWLRDTTHIFTVAGVAGAICLFVMARMEHRLGGVLVRLPLPEAILARVSGLLRQFLLGLHAVDQPRNLFRFVSLTGLIWLLDGVTGMAIAWAIHVSPSWSQMTILLVALSLASALPSTPGNIGVFPFVAISVLVPFGFTRSMALAYILVFQTVTYIVESAWGGIGLWRITVLSEPMLPSFVRGIVIGKETGNTTTVYHGAADAPQMADLGG